MLEVLKVVGYNYVHDFDLSHEQDLNSNQFLSYNSPRGETSFWDVLAVHRITEGQIWGGVSRTSKQVLADCNIEGDLCVRAARIEVKEKQLAVFKGPMHITIIRLMIPKTNPMNPEGLRGIVFVSCLAHEMTDTFVRVKGQKKSLLRVSPEFSKYWML